MFEAEGERPVVAGNIGTPLCEVVSRVKENTALVLEVSSYQLETTWSFRPTVGIVLNITPDHLARHGTLEDYARIKFQLFQNQLPSQVAVLNKMDSWSKELAKSLRSRISWFDLSSSLRPTHLLGQHNRENATAAALAARALGVSPSAIQKALKTFRGVEHRLETVRLWRGVSFVNDSKATNVDSTRVALQSFSGNLHVIMGGEDKGSPYGPLTSLLKAKARRVLLIGEAAKKIKKELGDIVPRDIVPVVLCGSLERAVEAAAQGARPGDVVLLSPACASFDQFDNFEHRGQVFKKLVHGLS
jgi:UDP-N-acetylmuramoylalanine--D-glutamate ligase